MYENYNKLFYFWHENSNSQFCHMYFLIAIDTKVGSDNCWCSESRNQSKSCENLQGSLYKNRTKFYMSGNDWIQINEFCKKVGWNFLFDFNVLKRNRKGNWRYVPKINFPIFLLVLLPHYFKIPFFVQKLNFGKITKKLKLILSAIFWQENSN